MWFVFPQLRGLGRSATAAHFGIRDLDEARRYLAHPLLGARLRAACAAMLAHAGSAPEAILGAVDALKLRSCATLFAAAGGGEPFEKVLAAFYGGRACAATLTAIGREAGGSAAAAGGAGGSDGRDGRC
ncbi:MAG: DUF1810 domain-containing protein [Roseovarius sp.]